MILVTDGAGYIGSHCVLSLLEQNVNIRVPYASTLVFEYFEKDGEKIISDYNEKFFKKKSLAVIYVITGSGNTYIEYSEAKVVDDKVTISYNKKIKGEVGTTVMGGYFIVVEVPKDVKEISDKE